MTRSLREILLLSIALAPACSDARSAEPIATATQTSLRARAAIESTYVTFVDAFRRGDAMALARTYTEDAQWLVPEASPVAGRPAIAEVWKGVIGAGGRRLRVDVTEVQSDGAWAHELGRFTISGKDGSTVAAGKYLVVWQRQENGEWKAHRDIFNWDVPPPRR